MPWWFKSFIHSHPIVNNHVLIILLFIIFILKVIRMNSNWLIVYKLFYNNLGQLKVKKNLNKNNVMILVIKLQYLFLYKINTFSLYREFIFYTLFCQPIKRWLLVWFLI